MISFADLATGLKHVQMDPLLSLALGSRLKEVRYDTDKESVKPCTRRSHA